MSGIIPGSFGGAHWAMKLLMVQWTPRWVDTSQTTTLLKQSIDCPRSARCWREGRILSESHRLYDPFRVGAFGGPRTGGGAALATGYYRVAFQATKTMANKMAIRSITSITIGRSHPDLLVGINLTYPHWNTHSAHHRCHPARRLTPELAWLFRRRPSRFATGSW